MAVEIGALRALLSLDSAAFEKGAKRAQASMGNLQRSLARAGQSMQRVGKKLTAAVTLPLVGIGTAAVASSLKVVDAQAKMAQSVGGTVRSMQNLGRAAELSGVSQGELDGALTRMTRRISLAERETGPAVKALDQLGLSASNLNNLDTDERLRTIVERIREVVPAAQQAGVASEIFGDRVGLAILRLEPDVIERASREIEAFGVAVSETDAGRIEAANDAISGLGLASRGLANQLTTALAPVLQTIAESIASAAQAFSDLEPEIKKTIAVVATFAAGLGPATLAIGLMTSGLASAATGVKILVGTLFTLRGALVASGIGIFAVAIGAAANAFISFAENAGEAEEAAFDAADANKELDAAIRGVTSAEGEGSAAVIALANNNVQLAKSALNAAVAEREKALAVANSVRVNLRGRDVEGNTAKAKRDLAEATSAVTQAEEDLASVQEKRAQVSGEIIRTLPEITSLTDKQTESTNSLTKARGRQSKGIEKLDAAAQRAKSILAEVARESVTYEDVVKQLTKSLKEEEITQLQFNKAKELAKEKFAEAETAGRQFAEGITDPIKRAFKSGELNAKTFADVVQGTLERLRDRLIDEVFKPIEDAIFEAFSGKSGGGGGGGILGSIASAIGGALGGGGPSLNSKPVFAASSNFIGQLDSGGRIGRGQSAIVGERRPEIVTGPANVTGGAETARMLGGRVVNNITVNAPPGSEVREERRDNSTGGEDLTILIDQAVSGLARDPSSRLSRTLNTGFGVSPTRRSR